MSKLEELEKILNDVLNTVGDGESFKVLKFLTYFARMASKNLKRLNNYPHYKKIDTELASIISVKATLKLALENYKKDCVKN
jgi:hypothetical protein